MMTVKAKTKNSSPISPFSIDELVKIKAKHSQAQRARLVSPIHPDRDIVGSLLSLGLSLRAAGKDVQIELTGDVSASFRLLDGAGQVRRRLEGRLLRAAFTKENREAVGYPDTDDAGRTFFLTSFDDSDIVVILFKQLNNRFNMSWRARPDMFDPAGSSLWRRMSPSSGWRRYRWRPVRGTTEGLPGYHSLFIAAKSTWGAITTT